MADSGYSFPLDVLAISLIQYSGAVRGSWTRGVAYTALVVATGTGESLYTWSTPLDLRSSVSWTLIPEGLVQTLAASYLSWALHCTYGINRFLSRSLAACVVD